MFSFNSYVRNAEFQHGLFKRSLLVNTCAESHAFDEQLSAHVLSFATKISTPSINQNISMEILKPLSLQANDSLRANIPGIFEITLTRAEFSDRKVLIGDTKEVRMLAGVKIFPSPIPAAWCHRLGEYDLIKPDVTSIFDTFQRATLVAS